jgi:hypothetical protein
VVMQMTIHWGEFCGSVERTEINFPSSKNETKNSYPAFKYDMRLRGYLPFSLFKNIQTKAWVRGYLIDPSISRQVIFYTKKFIDEFEVKT